MKHDIKCEQPKGALSCNCAARAEETVRPGAGVDLINVEAELPMCPACSSKTFVYHNSGRITHRFFCNNKGGHASGDIYFFNAVAPSPNADPVNHPSHYTEHPSGVECITITRHLNFNIGNAVKYLWRAGLKDTAPTVQDLEKAVWYITDEIKRLKGEAT